MGTIRTLQGYFRDDGCFIANGAVLEMPIKRRMIINIFYDDQEKDVQFAFKQRKKGIAGYADVVITDRNEPWPDEFADYTVRHAR